MARANSSSNIPQHSSCKCSRSRHLPMPNLRINFSGSWTLHVFSMHNLALTPLKILAIFSHSLSQYMLWKTTTPAPIAETNSANLEKSELSFGAWTAYLKPNLLQSLIRRLTSFSIIPERNNYTALNPAFSIIKK